MIKKLKRNAKRNNSFMWCSKEYVETIWGITGVTCEIRIKTYPKRKRGKR